MFKPGDRIVKMKKTSGVIPPGEAVIVIANPKGIDILTVDVSGIKSLKHHFTDGWCTINNQDAFILEELYNSPLYKLMRESDEF